MMNSEQPASSDASTASTPKPGKARQLWQQLRAFVFFILIFAAIRSAVADWNDVPSGSMMPTILIGDRIFVNKLAYDLKIPFTTTHLATWSNPSRGDVVVFYSPKDGTRLVKRVIGVPGDTLELRNDQLLINGQPAAYTASGTAAPAEPGAIGQLRRIVVTEAEPLSSHVHPMMVTPAVRALRNYGPVTVPPGKYFMMGDNRDNSFDSRYFGFVDRSAIVGRATDVVLSLDLNDHWLPRWKRFFTALP